MVKSLIALAILLGVATTADARRGHSQPPTQFNGDRYAWGGGFGPDVIKAVKISRSQAKPQAKRSVRQAAPGRRSAAAPQHARKWRHRSGKWHFNRRMQPAIARSFIADAAGALIEPARQIAAAVIGGRPAGCPHRFCGCALSIKVFGRSVRELWLAENWVRRFPRTAPAPGMVAARRGHALQLLSHISGWTWWTWDPNSGRGRIRIHARSIAGFAIVNPFGSRQARISEVRPSG